MFNDQKQPDYSQYPSFIYDQSAVIPFRYNKGQLEILLITSRNKKKWIIPKGIIEPGLTAIQSAGQEAFEEAGVRGSIYEECIGEYKYSKWGGTCTVKVYLMKVEQILADYPESFIRERRWVKLDQARNSIKISTLLDIFSNLEDRIKRIAD